MKSVSIAAESENRLELLKALRAKVAWELDNPACARDVEPLSRRDPSGPPADILRERREQRRRGDQPVAFDHTAGRGGGREHDRLARVLPVGEVSGTNYSLCFPSEWSNPGYEGKVDAPERIPSVGSVIRDGHGLRG